MKIASALLAFFAIIFFNTDIAPYGIYGVIASPFMDPFREGKTALFILSALLLASSWIGKTFDIFLGFAFAIISIKWVMIQHISSMGTIPVVGSMAFLFIGSNAAKFKHSLTIVRVIVHIQIAIGLLQIFGFNILGSIASLPWFGPGLPFGTLGNPAVLGALMAMVLPISFYKWSKAETLLILAMVFLTRSTMPVFAVIGAIAVYVYKKYGIGYTAPILMLCLLSLGGTILFPESEIFSFSGRLLVWSKAWHKIQYNLHGYGAGAWFGYYPQWKIDYKGVWDFVHNDWLQLLFEVGIIPFSLIVLAAIRIINRVPMWAACSMGAMMANAIGFFPFHLSALAFLFCLVLSLGINPCKNS